MKRLMFILAISIPLIIKSAFILSDENDRNRAFSPYVGKGGGISLPKDFRDNWSHLGAWVLPDNTAEGFHDVFTQPEVLEGYKKNNNRFPDGAVLVKEVRSTKSDSLTTGPNVLSAGEEVLWFVMIKDDKKRFPDNPNWRIVGDGLFLRLKILLRMSQLTSRRTTFHVMYRLDRQIGSIYKGTPRFRSDPHLILVLEK